MPKVNFAVVEQELEAAVNAGAFPGAVLLVGRGGQVEYHGAVGYRSLEPTRTPMHPDTVFDLSSLTKPLATATAFLQLVEQGRVAFDDRLTRFFPNFGVHGKTQVTFRHLLAHCSGLAAWHPFYKEVERIERHGRLNFLASRGARVHVYEQVHRERLEYPTASRSLYSDLGFMLLGEFIELITGTTLDRYCHERIFRPLGLRATGFVDLSLVRSRQVTAMTDSIAPTERCPWRKKMLCGEVHDDNAYAMGGVAGHAGLFATAADVHALAARLLACHRGADDFLPAALVRECWTPNPTVPDSTWALGWDTPSAKNSSAGERISRHAVGHLGFTGTSLWIDLEREIEVILLTNRVHPHRDNERIRSVRPRVHDAVMEALGA